ncbi:MAG: hypothetical protein Q8L41_01430 [Anaerolineales bacterium]|nr:hypothetical protein [Anaerolineales bacterium]
METNNQNTNLDGLFIAGDEILRRIADKAGTIFKIDSAGNLILESHLGEIGDVKYPFYIPMISRQNQAIAQLTGIDIKIVNARLAELRKERYVASPSRGEWKFIPFYADKFLSNILDGVKEGNQ